MGYHHQSTPVSFQCFFQPVGHVMVKMVCRLVQHQHICLGQKCRNQYQSLFLSTGKLFHRLLKIGHSKPGQHALRLCLKCRVSCLFSMIFQHCLNHVLPRYDFRVLGKKTNHNVSGSGHFATIRLFQSRQNAKKSGFSRSVNADNTHFFPFLQEKVCLIKQLSFCIYF